MYFHEGFPQCRIEAPRIVGDGEAKRLSKTLNLKPVHILFILYRQVPSQQVVIIVMGGIESRWVTFREQG
jgi:hypothetical protein